MAKGLDHKALDGRGRYLLGKGLAGKVVLAADEAGGFTADKAINRRRHSREEEILRDGFSRFLR